MMRTARDLFDLSGRVAIITGGAGMLGRQHAAAVAEAGGHPVIADLSEDTEGVAAALDIDAGDSRRETQVPLSIAVEVRYEDGTLAKKTFTSPDAAIGFLRDKSQE